MPAEDLARYDRQMRFPPIGEAGQQRLRAGRVALVGVGALGSLSAEWLVRAGVGHIRLIDRDFVELGNLQRQVLFDEEDVRAGLPKAEAAARKLRRINGTVAIEPVVADFSARNAERHCADVSLLLDGTDNLETRYLLNDVAVKHDLPWIYGACVADEGRVQVILPGKTPCLRCVWGPPPPAGTLPTCDTAGVLGPVVGLVASLQALEALKLLTGDRAAVNRRLIHLQGWSNRLRQLDLSTARDLECPCCGRHEFEFLSGRNESLTTVLCGRDAVQVTPAMPPVAGLTEAPDAALVDLDAVAARLPPSSAAQRNAFLLRFTAGGCNVTLFPDGRAIIQGTADSAQARSIYARYIGA